MKKIELKLSFVNKITPKREYINDELVSAGFNMNKSITIKPDSKKDIITYEQK